MNLTHREIRGIILLLLLVTAVTAVTTCGGSAERAVPAAAEPTEADAFVLDSMRLVETVNEVGKKKHAAPRDTAVHGDRKPGRGARKQRARNAAAPVPPRKSPLDEPVAR